MNISAIVRAMKDGRAIVRAVAALMLLAAAIVAGRVFTVNAEGRPDAEVKLYAFDLGKLKVGDVTRFHLSPQEIRPTDFFAVVGYLVVHPKGTLIWDTGVVPDAEVGTNAPGADRAGRKLVDQLAQVGFKPGDITYFALS